MNPLSSNQIFLRHTINTLKISNYQSKNKYFHLHSFAFLGHCQKYPIPSNTHSVNLIGNRKYSNYKAHARGSRVPWVEIYENSYHSWWSLSPKIIVIMSTRSAFGLWRQASLKVLIVANVSKTTKSRDIYQNICM